MFIRVYLDEFSDRTHPRFHCPDHTTEDSSNPDPASWPHLVISPRTIRNNISQSSFHDMCIARGEKAFHYDRMADSAAGHDNPKWTSYESFSAQGAPKPSPRVPWSFELLSVWLIAACAWFKFMKIQEPDAMPYSSRTCCLPFKICFCCIYVISECSPQHLFAICRGVVLERTYSLIPEVKHSLMFYIVQQRDLPYLSLY